jgi:hypothetical protein
MDAQSFGFINELINRGFFTGLIASGILIILCVLVHYEVLLLLSSKVKKLKLIPKRTRIVVMMLGMFAAHSIHVWLFGICYYIVANWSGAGTFLTALGEPHYMTLMDGVYYSIVTYTSLGFGDIIPQDASRLITGVETLLGLLMIAWSASFTYLEMEKHWRV